MSDPEEEWRFDVDDVDEEGIVEAEPDPIEPGTPATENVLFVLLGVALAVGIGYVTVAGVI